jgi:hypothetical protein
MITETEALLQADTAPPMEGASSVEVAPMVQLGISIAKGVVALVLCPMVLFGIGWLLARADPGLVTVWSSALWGVVFVAGVLWWIRRAKPVNVETLAPSAICWREGVALTAFIAAWMAPLARRATTFVYGFGDNEGWAFQSWRLGRELRAGRVPRYVPDVVWPYGVDLLRTDGLLATTVGALSAAVLRNAALAFNVSVLVAIAWNTVAGFFLCARFTHLRTVRTIGAMACATAPVVAIKYGFYFNLCFLGPLITLVGVNFDVMSKRVAIRPVRHGALIALCFFSSGYLFVFGVLSIAATWLAARRRPPAGRTVVTLAVTVLLMSPLIYMRFVHDRDESAAGARPISTESVRNSPELFDFVGQPMPDVSRPYTNPFELTTKSGLVLLMSIAALVTLKHSMRRPLLIVIGGLWLLTLGPSALVDRQPMLDQTWLPFGALLRLPIASSLRGPGRVALVIVPFAAVVWTIVATSWHARLGPRSRSVVAALALAVVVSAIPRDPTAARLEKAGPSVRSAFAELDAAPTLVLPGDCLDNYRLVNLMLSGAGPMVGCQGFTAAIPFASGLATYRQSSAWAALRCTPDYLVTVHLPQFTPLTPTDDAIVRLHSELGVGSVIFDRRASCSMEGRAAATEQALRNVAEVVGQDDRYIVFKLPTP